MFSCKIALPFKVLPGVFDIFLLYCVLCMSSRKAVGLELSVDMDVSDFSTTRRD